MSDRRATRPRASLQQVDSDSDNPFQDTSSDTCRDNDSDNCNDANSIDSLRLESIRTDCYKFGYSSILDAARHEAKSFASLDDTKSRRAHLLSVRQPLDEICSTYDGLGVFEKCPKAISEGLGGGVCTLALPLLIIEFEKIRKLASLNKSPSEKQTAHTSFDVSKIYQEMTECATNFIHLLDELMGASKDTSNKECRLVIALAIMAHFRNDHTNTIQHVIGLYLYALKTPKRAIKSLSKLGICVSDITISRSLRSAAEAARSRLKSIAGTGKAFITVFDNLTFTAPVRYARLDNQSDFITWTAGYVLLPPASRSPPAFNQLTDFNWNKISDLPLSLFFPKKEDNQNLTAACRALIGKTVKEFAEFETVAIKNRPACDLPIVDRIDCHDPPEIYPLPTYDLNEAISADMIQLLYEIQDVIGLSKRQRLENLYLYSGDLMSVEGMRYPPPASTRIQPASARIRQTLIIFRNARFRQSECTEHQRLRYIEPVTGMFHLFMAALALFYKVHFGDRNEFGTLSFWMEFLQRDPGKLWNDHDPTHVQDFNACLDLFNILLDGYLIAALCQKFEGATSARMFSSRLPKLSSNDIQTVIDSLAAMLGNQNEVPFTESVGERAQGTDRPNMVNFLKHALLLRTFHKAMQVGDTGLMMNALKFISVWFQGSDNHKYASECLRLIAFIKGGVFSKRLAKFFMQNTLVNLSGKQDGFIALDMLNEYIVREVKDMIPSNLTPSTDHRVRNVCSLLVMDLREIRRRVSAEIGVNIFDHHSSPVSGWRDSVAVANKLLTEGIAGERNNNTKMNLYLKGQATMGKGAGLKQLKSRWLGEEIDDEPDGIGETESRGSSEYDDSSGSDSD